MEHSTKRRKLSSSSRTRSTKDEDLGDSSQATKSHKQEGESSPARCPICLAPPENRAKSESCSHFFCFSCLKEWSKVKAECPLCKMPIRTIFYNIKSEGEFDKYRVKTPRAEAGVSGFSHPGLIGTNSFENWWAYRIREYRAQLRRRQENELAAREASRNINAIRTRRMYYWNKTSVCHVDTGNRVRDVSAEFFCENPSQMHRLVPWLKRELTVLYGIHNTCLISCVRDKIMAAVSGNGITSQSFVNLIQPYLLEHTNQFVHEFVSFAKSPYDINQYDRRAQYVSSQDSSAPHQRTSRRNRGSSSNRSLHLRSRLSRWDDSPDARETLNEPSSQSVMLSQTTWGDNAASQCPIIPVTCIDSSGDYRSASSMPINASTARELSPSQQESLISTHGIPNPSYHYSGLHPLGRYGIASGNDNTRDVKAPLDHQTIDVHRPGGSSTRQHDRMEIMRQHFDQHTRRRHAEARKRRASRDPAALAMSMQSNPHKVIVISSDSEDTERNQTVVHCKPSTFQSAEEQQHVERKKIKKERSAECSSVHSSDSPTKPDDNDIEFVKYIKPPHLRTPDVFIELSSTDDDAPGPSTRRDDVSKATLRRSSSSDSSSSLDKHSRYHQQHGRKSGSDSLDRNRSGDVQQRTKEFFRNAREAPRKPWEPLSDNGEIDVDSSSSSDSSSSLDKHSRYHQQHRRKSGSDSLDRSRSGDVQQRTKEFFRNAREAPRKPWKPPSDDGEIDVASSSSSDSSSSLDKRSRYHQRQQHRRNSGSASLDTSRSGDVQQHAKEFFRNAREAPWEPPPSDDGEIDVASSSSLDSSSKQSRYHQQHRQKSGSASLDRSRSGDVLQHTKESCRNAREAPRKPWELPSDDGEIDVEAMLEGETTDAPVTVPHSYADVRCASLDRSRSGDVLQRTEEFFRNEAPIKPWEHPSGDGKIDVEGVLEGGRTDAPVTVPHSYADVQRESSQYIGEILPDETTIQISGEMTSPISAVTFPDGTASSSVTSQNSLLSGMALSQQDKNPKKVFERGKVSINFAKSKRNRYYDSDSDSDIDVGVEHIVPAASYLWVPVIQENLPRGATQITDIVSAGDVAAIADSIVKGGKPRNIETNDCHTLKSRSSSSDLSGESRRYRKKSSPGSKHKHKHKHADRYHSQISASKESNNDDLYSTTKSTKHRSCEDPEFSRFYSETHDHDGSHCKSKESSKKKNDQDTPVWNLCPTYIME